MCGAYSEISVPVFPLSLVEAGTVPTTMSLRHTFVFQRIHPIQFGLGLSKHFQRPRDGGRACLLRSTKFSTGSSTAMCRHAWSSTSRGANNDEPVCISHSAFSRRILTVGNQVGAVWTVISRFGAKGSGRIEPNQVRTIVRF